MVASALLSCSGDPVANNPVSSMSKTGSTDNQQVPAGTLVPVSPEVEVLLANGEPAVGVPVTFSVASGGGSVNGAVDETNSRGLARVQEWILGPTAGPNTLRATVGEFEVMFTAIGVPGAPANIILMAGNEQTATILTEVPIDPQVKAIDAFGNGVQGVTVNWQVTAGGGRVIGQDVILSESDGLVTIEGWQMGGLPRQNVLEATAQGLGTVIFTATATP